MAGVMDPGTAQLNGIGSYAFSNSLTVNAGLPYGATTAISSERWIVTSEASSTLQPYIAMSYIIKT